MVFTHLPRHDEEDFLGWYREDTGALFDPEEPVTEDLCLYPQFSGYTEPEPEEKAGLRDLILKVYHYVPVMVLLLIAAVAVPVAVWKNRDIKKEKTGSKV